MLENDSQDNRTEQQVNEGEAASKQPADQLHVITENGEQCFMWRSQQLSYIAQDRAELPQVLAEKFGPLATKLDLSYNSLNSFKNINSFTRLNELILDNNNLEDEHLEFKQNLRLKTLSLNKNRLTDLYKLVKAIKICFPNLEFLSLIGNPLCPTLVPTPAASCVARRAETTSVVVDGRHLFDVSDNNSSSDLSCSLALDGKQQHQSEFSYQKYRYFILYHLPNLRFLDSSPISGSERDEALRRFYWMEASQPTSVAPVGNEESARHYSQRQHNSGIGHPIHTNSNLSASQEAGFQLSIITSHSNEAQPPPRGAFSRLAYKYTGKNSEGNRFIRNHDL